MQRLYTVFPCGASGAALLLARLGMAAALVAQATLAGSQPAWLLLSLPVAVGCLVAGLLTPFAYGGCCLLAFAVAAPAGGGGVAMGIALPSVSVALAILGPGAYSVDARLFGRRRLKIGGG